MITSPNRFAVELNNVQCVKIYKNVKKIFEFSNFGKFVRCFSGRPRPLFWHPTPRIKEKVSQKHRKYNYTLFFTPSFWGVMVFFKNSKFLNPTFESSNSFFQKVSANTLFLTPSFQWFNFWAQNILHLESFVLLLKLLGNNTLSVRIHVI